MAITKITMNDTSNPRIGLPKSLLPTKRNTKAIAKKMPMFIHALAVISVSGIYGPPFGSQEAHPANMSSGMLRSVTTQSSVRNRFIFLREKKV